jgi:hypothetical protein
MKDLVDRRVLGAVQFSDAVTTAPVLQPLIADFRPLRVLRNTSGMYVVLSAPGMDTFTGTFDTTGVTPPAAASFTISVTDPSRQYLPRRASIKLPRSTSPTDPDNVFQPTQISLYPAPSASTRATWASVFVQVVSASDPNARLPWVLLQTQNAGDSSLLSTTLTDGRGEAQILLPVAGIRANASGVGGVVTTGTDIKIVATYDPSTPDPSTPLGSAFVPNPDDIIAHAGDPSMKKATVALTVTAGATRVQPIKIALA